MLQISLIYLGIKMLIILGLYCYLNAVLQALLGTNCFVNDLTNWNEQEENDDLVMSFSQLSRFKDEGNQTETRFAIR